MAMVYSNGGAALATDALTVIGLLLRHNALAQKLFAAGGHMSKLVAPLTFTASDLLEGELVDEPLTDEEPTAKTEGKKRYAGTLHWSYLFAVHAQERVVRSSTTYRLLLT
jgi:hypothetical protein